MGEEGVRHRLRQAAEAGLAAEGLRVGRKVGGKKPGFPCRRSTHHGTGAMPPVAHGYHFCNSNVCGFVLICIRTHMTSHKTCDVTYVIAYDKAKLKISQGKGNYQECP
jgi:hypothetical protein